MVAPGSEEVECEMYYAKVVHHGWERHRDEADVRFLRNGPNYKLDGKDDPNYRKVDLEEVKLW